MIRLSEWRARVRALVLHEPDEVDDISNIIVINAITKQPGLLRLRSTKTTQHHTRRARHSPKVVTRDEIRVFISVCLFVVSVGAARATHVSYRATRQTAFTY